MCSFAAFTRLWSAANRADPNSGGFLITASDPDPDTARRLLGVDALRLAFHRREGVALKPHGACSSSWRYGAGNGSTAAYFSLAPFIGALVAIVLLHDPLSVKMVLSGALMASDYGRMLLNGTAFCLGG